MKFTRGIASLALVALLVAVELAISAAPASASQSTWTCTGQGQYDMLSLMVMQKSYLNDSYYLQGTGYTWKNGGWVINSSETNPNGTVLHNDVPQVSTYTGPGNQEWATGKINMVKDYQGEPDGISGGMPQYYTTPPFGLIHGTSTCSTRTTFTCGLRENVWGDAYSYKAFNNGSSNNSMLFTRRCVVPGDDGTTSVLVNSPMGNGSNTTEYFTVPDSSPAYTSADCNSSLPAQDLKYSIMTVEAVQPNSYTLYDTLNNNQQISLSIVPVTYQWDCKEASGECGTEETYEFGFDANNNYYGLMQWSSYSSPSNNSQYTTPNSLSVFNYLEQWNQTQLGDEKGGTTVSFPCNPI